MGLLSILKWNAIGIVLLPPTVLVSCIVYENIWYHWHKSKRKRAMLLFITDDNEEEYEEEDYDVQEILDNKSNHTSKYNNNNSTLAHRLPTSLSVVPYPGTETTLHDPQQNNHHNSSKGTPTNIEKTSWAGLEMSLYNFNMRLIRSIMIAGKFINPFPEWQDRNILDLFEHLKWHITRHRHEDIVPMTTPNFEIIQQICKQPHEYQSQISCTWIGQSCMFIQMEGINILTDPHFSKTSTGSWFGPKRLRTNPPCQLDELPSIDLVLVSHDHYDHLDLHTIKHLKNDTTTWCVPLGLDSLLKKYGIKKIIELDWWQEIQYRNILVVATPAQHWSGRYIIDTNRSLWSSFVVKGPHTSFFHCGDTGYCRVFKHIGDKYGPFTLTALPIGSYSPRWFMKHQHINPTEASRIHQDLKAKHSIGVHWGTFVMSDEPIDEPPKLFLECNPNVDGELWVTQQGETIVVD